MNDFNDELTVVPLPLVRPTDLQGPVTPEEVARVAARVKRSGNRWVAFKAAIERAGLDEEEVRDALAISAPLWSTFQKLPGEKGAKHFSHQLFYKFNDVVNNNLVIQVDAYLAGLGCVRLKTALELENEFLKSQMEEKDRRHEYLLQSLREIKAAQ